MKVSVIIPVWNEARCIARTLESVCGDIRNEVLVVDAGSEDETAAIARRYARVLDAPRGRAAQQNVGAAAASGDVLFFLHADCWPEQGWREAIVRAAERPGFAAGAFRMRIDGAKPLYRTIERGGDLRVRWLALPYGDQGIFLKRDTFFALGGFPPVRFMEDLLFIQRASRLGRIELVPHTLHISSRRWSRTGVVRQTLRNWWLTTLAVGFGIHPDKLAKFYPVVR